MTTSRPPRLLLVLLECLLPDDEPLIGDIIEEFRARPSTAWLWWQVLSAMTTARCHRDDEIRPLRLVDLQPLEAVERAHALDRRLACVNMAASPLASVGGLGLVALAGLVSRIAPQAWWVVLAAIVAGVCLGIGLIVVSRTTRARSFSTSHTIITALIALAAAVCVSRSAAAQPQSDRKPPTPIEAIAGILDAFRSHDVVGLSAGADHGDARGPAFVASFIRDARFRPTTIDLAVENANARYQEVMDRFTSGQDVPYEELRHVWDDTTQPQTIVTEIPEIYRALRDANAGLPREGQHRAILGDPPIDWSGVHTKADFQTWLAQRDSYPVGVIEREVLSKGRRALVVYGSGHLQRKQQASNYLMQSPLAQTVISLLDRTAAKTLVVVTIGDPFIPAVGTDAWPVPSLAALRGTRLGAQAVGQGALGRVSVRDGGFVPIPREQWVDLPLEQQFDAVLYLGPASTRTQTARSKAVCDERGYVDTRLKRIALAGLPSSVAKQVQDFCAKVARRRAALRGLPLHPHRWTMVRTDARTA